MEIIEKTQHKLVKFGRKEHQRRSLYTRVSKRALKKLNWDYEKEVVSELSIDIENNRIIIIIEPLE